MKPLEAATEILYNQADVCTMASLLPAAFTLSVNIVLIILWEIWRARSTFSLSLSVTFLWCPSLPFFLNEPGSLRGRPSTVTILSYYVSPSRATEEASSTLTQPLRLGKVAVCELSHVRVGLITAALGASGAPDAAAARPFGERF